MSAQLDARIQWLHKQIFEKRYPNAFRLAEKFNISHRQAQRDIDYLRTEMKAPLAYSAKNRGFYYTESFSIPSYSASANNEGYSDIMASIKDSHYDRVGESQTIQMQIPYSAKIEISSKLGALELKDFIVMQESRRIYLCEFHNPDLFLGALLTIDADVRILSPDWLRVRAVNSAERLLKNNMIKENDNDE